MATRNKHNFSVDFTNTMASWDAETSPYSTGTPQASPSRPAQDPIRRDYGALWSAPFGRWDYGLPPEPGRTTSPGDRAPNSLIEGYSFKTYVDFNISRDGTVTNNYSPETLNPVSALISRDFSQRPRLVVNSAGTEEFYGNEAPYGYVRQRIRIEANLDLLPQGGIIRTYAAGDSDTGFSLGDYPDAADIEAWRNWCVENYYGREVGGSQQGYYKTYVDHCSTYDSPYTPLEEQLSPNDRVAATTHFEYNYYIKGYETTLSAEPVESERIVPHIYTMYFEKARGMGIEGAQDVPAGSPSVADGNYNEDYLYSDFVTLSRSLSKVFMNTMRLERFNSFADPRSSVVIRPRQEKAGESDAGEYFEKWTGQYNRIYNPVAGSGYPSPRRVENLNLINSKYKNLLFTRNAAEESQVYNRYNVLFPMYSQVRFPLVYSQFMGSLAGTQGDRAAFLTANTSTIARVWDGYHGAQQREYLSEYLLKVNFAENHQSGDNILATEGNITNGTERTAFRIADMFENLDSSRTAAGANIRFVEDFASFRTTMGVTTAENPADDRRFIIDTNIEEDDDERIIDLDSGISYNAFADNMIEHLQLLSQAYLRRYTEMLEGAPSYTAPLYYRVNKYQRLNGQRGNLIQTVIVPQYTVVKDKIFNYIDTQLRYENDYEYDITVYNVIVGSKYRFTELYLPVYTDDGAIIRDQIQYFGPPILAQQTPRDRARLSFDQPDGTRVSVATAEPDSFEAIADFAPVVATDVVGGVTERPQLSGNGSAFFAEIEVVVEPSIVVVEAPYIGSGYPWMPTADTSFGIGTILDDPGVSPNVQIIPYRGVNNKMLFNLTTGTGRELKVPITLSAAENAYIQRLRGNNGGANGLSVIYENEEPSKAFEIYRLSSLPSSYADFFNNQIAYIPTDDKTIGYRAGSAVSYVDDMQPNTRYYYMFRSIDIHGHYSYPSEIYEIELIDDSGAVYPRVRVVDPASMQNRKASQKNLKRFFTNQTPTFSETI